MAAIKEGCVVRKLSVLVAASLLSTVISGVPVRSEETDDSKMDEILVVPKGKIADEVTTAPAVIETRTAEELKRINKVDSSDVFRNMPDVYVRKLYPGSTNRPIAIRANPSSLTARSLVLMDGILISNFLGSGSSNGPRWQAVAPDEIERVDLIYGPFSAALSGNSLGGTALISTHLPQKREMSIEAGYTYQNADEYKTSKDMHGYTAHASYGDKVGPLSLMLWYDRLETRAQVISFMTPSSSNATSGTSVSGYVDDRDPQGNRRYIIGSAGTTYVTNNTAKLKLAYDLPGDSQLRFNYVFWDSTQNYDSPESYLRDSAGNPVYSGTIDINGTRYTVSPSAFYYQSVYRQDMLYALSYSRKPASGLKLAVDLSCFDIFKDLTQKSSEAPPSSGSGGAGTVVDNDGGWYTADIKGSYDINWLGNHTLSSGYHFDHYIVDTKTWLASNWKNDTRTSLSQKDRGKTSTHAVFLEDTWNINPHWTLYLGGRYEWWNGFDGSKYVNSTSGGGVTNIFPNKSDNGFSPKFSVAYRPTPDWSFRYSLGIANRYPTVGELYYAVTNASGVVSISNPNLKPEHILAHDFTITRNFWGYGEGRLTFFQNEVDDAIYSQNNVNNATSITTKYYQNVDEVRTRGIEVSIDLRKLPLEGLGISANAAWANAEIMKNDAVPASVGKQFPGVPKWRAKFTVDYAPTERWFLTFSGNYSSRPYYNLDNSDTSGGYGGYDEYLVFDTKASCKINDNLTASVGVDNLTNVLYHEFHPYPRRTVYANMKYTF